MACKAVYGGSSIGGFLLTLVLAVAYLVSLIAMGPADFTDIDTFKFNHVANFDFRMPGYFYAVAETSRFSNSSVKSTILQSKHSCIVIKKSSWREYRLVDWIKLS